MNLNLCDGIFWICVFILPWDMFAKTSILEFCISMFLLVVSEFSLWWQRSWFWPVFYFKGILFEVLMVGENELFFSLDYMLSNFVCVEFYWMSVCFILLLCKFYMKFLFFSMAWFFKYWPYCTYGRLWSWFWIWRRGTECDLCWFSFVAFSSSFSPLFAGWIVVNRLFSNNEAVLVSEMVDLSWIAYEFILCFSKYDLTLL